VSGYAIHLILEVSRLLNDAEPGYAHIRWPRTDLLEYLNDAQRQVYLYRPELYANTSELTLMPGTRQGPLPDGCQLQKIIGSTGDAGRARKVDDGLLQAFADTGCAPVSACVDYRVRGYSFTPQDPQFFFVDPPVPDDGGTYSVALVCQQSPEPITLAQLDDVDPRNDRLVTPARMHNALVEWMLYRAYSVDMESAQSFAKQEAHRQHFYAMLGVSEAKERLVAVSQAGRAPEGARP
jgi:hypothetical protein